MTVEFGSEPWYDIRASKEATNYKDLMLQYWKKGVADYVLICVNCLRDAMV